MAGPGHPVKRVALAIVKVAMFFATLIAAVPIGAAAATDTFTYAKSSGISGAVAVASTHRGVGNVCVRAIQTVGGAAYFVTTDGDGMYTISGLATGSYTVQTNVACSGSTEFFVNQSITDVGISAGATTLNVDFALVGNSPPSSAAAGFHKLVTSMSLSVSEGSIHGSAVGTHAYLSIPKGSLKHPSEVVLTGGLPSSFRVGHGRKVVADVSVVLLNPNNGKKLPGPF